jgi:hypothetical protein
VKPGSYVAGEGPVRDEEQRQRYFDLKFIWPCGGDRTAGVSRWQAAAGGRSWPEIDADSGR